MEKMRLVALDDTVVFPGMTVTLPLETGDATTVLLLPRHANEYAKVGTVAEVVEKLRLPGGGNAVLLNGTRRGIPGQAQTDTRGNLQVEVELHTDELPPPIRIQHLEREYRAVVEEILDLRGADDRVRTFVRAITEPGVLADTSGYAPDLTFAQKVRILETLDVVERLELSLEFQRERVADHHLGEQIPE